MLTHARAINSFGDIAATGTIGGQTRAFLLTAERDDVAVPAPGVLPLLALGLAGIAALRRK